MRPTVFVVSTVTHARQRHNNNTRFTRYLERNRKIGLWYFRRWPERACGPGDHLVVKEKFFAWVIFSGTLNCRIPADGDRSLDWATFAILFSILFFESSFFRCLFPTANSRTCQTAVFTVLSGVDVLLLWTHSIDTVVGCCSGDSFRFNCADFGYSRKSSIGP